MLSIWDEECKRANVFKPTNSCICSTYFLPDDYNSGYLMCVQLMPHEKYLPVLKPDAIISYLSLPSLSSWYEIWFTL